ncbi:MAG: 4-(cytidine 5'-diphospho)-2-C-methyl-D-erythritol kinase [Chloroflexota bacterium]
MLELQARAKINLTLEVLGRRPDGYHEILSVMQAVDLHDTLRLELAEGLSLTSNWPHLETPDNLVLKAARLLKQAAKVDLGAQMHLVKAIPLAAGLGGGSSDAAAALQGLNELWGRPLPGEELVTVASAVGSDVPFFLVDGTALAEGRGERVTKLPPLRRRWVVLVTPSVEVQNKTAYLYSLLSPQDYSAGVATREVVEALRSGESPDPSLFVNVFQPIALDRFPDVRRWHDSMFRLGAERVWLAGSGPTLFTLCSDEGSSRYLARLLEAEGATVLVTRTV